MHERASSYRQNPRFAHTHVIQYISKPGQQTRSASLAHEDRALYDTERSILLGYLRRVPSPFSPSEIRVHLGLEELVPIDKRADEPQLM